MKVDVSKVTKVIVKSSDGTIVMVIPSPSSFGLTTNRFGDVVLEVQASKPK